MNACVHTYTKPQTSSTRSRGLGWRIHGRVEDTKLSTNKQHSLSLAARSSLAIGHVPSCREWRGEGSSYRPLAQPCWTTLGCVFMCVLHRVSFCSMRKETYLYAKRDLFVCQNRPTFCSVARARDLYFSLYFSLLICFFLSLLPASTL
jgi:hypothetical protein